MAVPQTKFLLAVAVFATSTVLLIFGKIDQETWEQVTIWGFGIYAGGNTTSTLAHQWRKKSE